MINYKKFIFTFILTGIIAFTGCKVGPNYVRPEFRYDSLFRFSAGTDSVSYGSQQWTTLLKDPVLQDLINKGIKNNFDIRIAFARIEEASNYVKAARGAQWPQLGVSADGGWYNSPFGGKGTTLDYSQFTGVANISYEVDLWGKLRRAKESARANFFGQVAYQQLVRIKLINGIVESYFNIIEYDNEMRIILETIDIRQKSLDLVKAKMIAGTASGLVVAQAEAELALAQQEVPKLELLIGREENYLALLIGEAPQAIRRGLPLMEQMVEPAIRSTGFASTVILNRPDVIMAEQSLISANADIGVARAKMLPSLTISGYAGTTFNPANFIYSAVGNLVAPIFAGGQLRANVKISQARKEQMLLSYQKTIVLALGEVSDAILEVNKTKDIVESQQKTYEAAKTAFDLSNQLYDAGYASYLDVINTQEKFLRAQINLSLSQSDELTAMVNLYTALGGGLN